MRKSRNFIIGSIFLVLMCVAGCNPSESRKAEMDTDLLNSLSYLQHYKNLASTRNYAELAYKEASHYSYHSGKAEAMNNLAFYYFMRMDFDGARRELKRIYSTTNNELELLVADIGMMKICQRTSSNKEFYDYRNRAQRRLARLEDEKAYFSEREANRFIYAESEFHIVSSVYYYYLQQEQQSMDEILQVNPNGDVKKDIQQLLQLYYMKGSGDMCEGDSLTQIRLREFDYLINCIQISKSEGYPYFQANSLQALSEALLNPQTKKILYENRYNAIRSFKMDEEPDSLLPLNLSRRALALFKQYDDYYQIAGTYRTIASSLFELGRYSEALDTLQRALDYVNLHHAHYYHSKDSVHLLALYRPEEQASLEMQWIKGGKVQTVSEWIARLREQISLTYSALGMKPQSDYNRNIYLDILDVTRQDKELENRYEALEKESNQMNIWLGVVIVAIILIILLLWVVNSIWKKRNMQQIDEIRQALEICRKVTSNIPVDVQNIRQVTESISEHVGSDFKKLFCCEDFCIHLKEDDGEEQDNFQPMNLHMPLHISAKGLQAEVQMQREKELSKDEKALIKVILPYIEWTMENASIFLLLGDRRKQLEKEKYVYEQHIIDNKRENLNKKACMALVNDINPFLNRIINEVSKLANTKDTSLRQERYLYISELTDRINEYNDILSLWIKMKQGTLSLHIENVQLAELFSVVEKSRKSFEQKNQTLTIKPTHAQVKADKALTLFMLNTLMENARKYTQNGGHISVKADEADDYVEISVQDDGIGIQEADVQKILGEKVYDSAQIGNRNSEILKNKGYGFGLINCKGIIEKYRKMGSLFGVCAFLIDSAPQKGSRFSFRLPKAVRQIVPAMLLLLMMNACSHSQPEKPVKQNAAETYDSLVIVASEYADSAYYSNVYGYYSDALVYADSALVKINQYNKKQQAKLPKAKLYGDGPAAEIGWLNRKYDMDYYLLLDIRNEAAVAALALRQWQLYRYNNAAYTTLYKLVSEDNSIEDYCRTMQSSSNNKMISIIVCVLLLISFLVIYYIIYFRQRILYRLNLEQILDINKKIFACTSANGNATGEELPDIPAKIVESIYADIHALRPIKAMGLSVYDNEAKHLNFAFKKTEEINEDYVKEQMQFCFAKETVQNSADNTIHSFPLTVDIGEEKQCIGVFSVVHVASTLDLDSDALLFMRLITRYLSIAVWNAIIRMSHTYREIETVEDEKRRAIFEDSQLYVQNQVLDNCFSTLKHETLYYPTRIKQIVDRLGSATNIKDEKEQIETLSQLTIYYQEIFTLLSACANRQLEDITFKRTIVQTDDILDKTNRYLTKLNKRKNTSYQLEIESNHSEMIGDFNLLCFMFENLLDEAASTSSDNHAVYYIQVQNDGDFVRFSFTNPTRHYTQQQLNELFYPQLSRMQGQNGNLQGTEFLLCKQIIRDHDQYTGHKGCRIVAEMTDNGCTVWWTVPRKTYIT